MGLYNERTFIDWLLIDMYYNTTTKKSHINCSDGVSTFDKSNEVNEDVRINCFLDSNRSQANVTDDGLLSFEVHFIRPFKTDGISKDQPNEDLQIELGQKIGA